MEEKKSLKLFSLSEKQLFYVAFLFFVFMMLLNLTHSSPWGDEWIEYEMSQRAIMSAKLYKGITHTFQPPLYNFLMHFWLKLSSSLLWFRLFNVLLGTISGIFFYLTLEHLCNSKLASYMLVALGITYQWIYCTQECSEYALMLMFLFMAFYFYVMLDNGNRLSIEIAFILSCVGAMYSQYGAFFIVAPLLLLHFIYRLFYGRKNDLLKTIGLYIFSFISFTIPLYIFFARKQLANNKIAEFTKIVLSKKEVIDFPLVFGRLMGYIVNINKYAEMKEFITAIGILIIICSVILLLNKKISIVTKNLILVLLLSYVMFYWLVTFHVYAMVHPNQSSGYYSRYSYFFIPAFFVIVPVIIYNITSLIKSKTFNSWSIRTITGIVMIVFLIPYPSVLDNWHKAYDREFAEVWLKNAGFNDTTFLMTSTARHGFNYFVRRESKCKITGKILGEKDINLNKLPDVFWLWKSNWGGNKWKSTIESATKNGYNVNIFYDYGGKGQLAFCESPYMTLKKTK